MMGTVVSKHDSADEYGLVVIAASFTMHKKDSFNDLFSKLCRGLKPRTPARQGACPSQTPPLGTFVRLHQDHYNKLGYICGKGLTV